MFSSGAAATFALLALLGAVETFRSGRISPAAALTALRRTRLEGPAPRRVAWVSLLVGLVWVAAAVVLAVGVATWAIGAIFVLVGLVASLLRVAAAGPAGRDDLVALPRPLPPAAPRTSSDPVVVRPANSDRSSDAL